MDEEKVIDKKWVRKRGFVSEHKIDARWVLYIDGNPKNKPEGSLRLVSLPGCPPGYVDSFCSIVTKRTPKTKEEIENTITTHELNEEELELYSVNEKLELWDTKDRGPLYKLEKLYGVKVFE